MKYHVSFLIVLMLVQLSCSTHSSPQQSAQQIDDGPTLSLGMSHEAALRIIQECGGLDVTSYQSVVGPNGEWPLHGIYWNLEQYNAVVAIGARDGNVVGIIYWTIADFDESKLHREKSKRDLKSLTFNQRDKTLVTVLR